MVIGSSEVVRERKKSQRPWEDLTHSLQWNYASDMLAKAHHLESSARNIGCTDTSTKKSVPKKVRGG